MEKEKEDYFSRLPVPGDSLGGGNSRFCECISNIGKYR